MGQGVQGSSFASDMLGAILRLTMPSSRDVVPEGYGVAVATTLPALFYIFDSSWSASVEALLSRPTS